MGSSAKAMIAGIVDKVTIAAMAEQALGVTAQAEHGDDPGYVVMQGGDLGRKRNAFVSHCDTDAADVMRGMRTVVDVGIGPEGEAILRGLLSFEGGVLCRDDSTGKWEYVQATRSFEPTPDQAMNAALHAFAEPNDVMALMRAFSDATGRATLEAILVARREAEPDFSPKP